MLSDSSRPSDSFAWLMMRSLIMKCGRGNARDKLLKTAGKLVGVQGKALFNLGRTGLVAGLAAEPQSAPP